MFIVASGNVGEQRAHVADMRDRDADLADLAARQRMVAVVAGLGRQIEGDGKPGLALGEIGAVEAIGFERGRMAGVGAENPGLVARRRVRSSARLHLVSTRLHGLLCEAQLQKTGGLG